jgi:hypothetical protein
VKPTVSKPSVIYIGADVCSLYAHQSIKSNFLDCFAVDLHRVLNEAAILNVNDKEAHVHVLHITCISCEYSKRWEKIVHLPLIRYLLAILTRCLCTITTPEILALAIIF